MLIFPTTIERPEISPTNENGGVSPAASNFVRIAYIGDRLEICAMLNIA